MAPSWSDISSSMHVQRVRCSLRAARRRRVPTPCSQHLCASTPFASAQRAFRNTAPTGKVALSATDRYAELLRLSCSARLTVKKMAETARSRVTTPERRGAQLQLPRRLTVGTCGTSSAACHRTVGGAPAGRRLERMRGARSRGGCLRRGATCYRSLPPSGIVDRSSSC